VWPVGPVFVGGLVQGRGEFFSPSRGARVVGAQYLEKVYERLAGFFVVFYLGKQFGEATFYIVNLFYPGQRGKPASFGGFGYAGQQGC